MKTLNQIEYTVKENPNLFDKLSFVCEAIHKVDWISRMSLTTLKVEKDKIVATNGHVMHIVYGDFGLDVGMYKVVKHLKKNIILEWSEYNDEQTYCDYEKTIPKSYEKDYTKVELINHRIPDTAYAMVLRALPNDTGLNYYFFTTVFEAMKLEHNKIDVYVKEINDPIVIKAGKHFGLIMPIRMTQFV